MRAWLVALVAVVAACGGAKETPPATPEQEIRARLGVPDDARTVVVFAQTAHLDIDWQQTFDDYYANFVEQIFLDARRLLDAQPRAAYSVGEMAFLAHHLERHPEEEAPLAGHAARGALRIVGGGVTSPDTLLPETELLLRDFALGARFAEETLGVRPRAAWFPDNFGHSGTAPDILAAAGYDSVGFARIDGAATFYELLDHPDAPPKPGSTWETLAALGSADFVWRGPGGAEVLAHYVAYNLYCTGDDLDYDEVMQYPGGHLGPFKGDDHDFTDGKIDGYIAKLAPFARTPYLFVPVGCDFQPPKERLLEYLDGYNKRRYPHTGAFAVAAPFEDYAVLVDAHRADLPVIEGELSPYFMGFYATRPGLKRRIREAARPFLAVEPFAAALGHDGAAVTAALRPDLERLLRANHHDFIPGTSTDAVVAGEQLPLLDAAEAAGQGSLAEVADRLAALLPDTEGRLARVLVLNPAGAGRSEVVDVEVAFYPPLVDLALAARADATPVPLEVLAGTPGDGGYQSATVRLALTDLGPWSWRAIDLRAGVTAPLPAAPVASLLDAAGQPASGDAVVLVRLANEHVSATWERPADRARAFALTSLTFDGVEALAGESFVVSDYTDEGGLWRMGHEMAGCSYAAIPPSAEEAQGETVTVLESTGLRASVVFTSARATREASLVAGGAGLDLALTAAADVGTTRAVAFAFVTAPDDPLRTSAAGGFLERTPERVYSPTYWPAVAWASSGPHAVLLRQSTGVRFGASGEVEVLAVRDARQERCDVEGGTGTDPDAHRLEWRLVRAESPAAAEAAAQAFNRPLVAVPNVVPGTQAEFPLEASLAQIEGDGVLQALKPADRGDGIILRVLLLPGPATVRSPLLQQFQVVRVDAAERDLEELGPFGEALTLDAARFGAIVTLRLRAPLGG
jgi:hypothetical protein